MTCDEARQMLAGYADGELSPLENEAIVAHLEQCGRCRQIVHDQQRVQHVLDQYEPPPVPDDAWNEIARALRAEAEGKGEPIQLKTRPRIEGLEPTPKAGPPVSEIEVPAPPPPAPKIPPPRPPRRVKGSGRSEPAVTILRARSQPRRTPWRWLAHAVGAAAAAAIIVLSLAPLWLHRAPPLRPNALARQDDVTIMELETDADYTVILYAGDTDGVVSIWVEPDT